MLTVWDWLRNSIFQIQQQQIIPQASCWNKKRSFGGYVRRFGNQAHDDLHDLKSSKMLLALLETKVWLKSSVGDEWSTNDLVLCWNFSQIVLKFWGIEHWHDIFNIILQLTLSKTKLKTVNCNLFIFAEKLWHEDVNKD